MNDTVDTRTATIAWLNDELRKRRSSQGRILITPGVAALDAADRLGLEFALASFDDFNEDNDPYGEHDFGAVTVKCERYFFKIDYYADSKCDAGAEDPADPSTFRVMTVMRSDEY